MTTLNSASERAKAEFEAARQNPATLIRDSLAIAFLVRQYERQKALAGDVGPRAVAELVDLAYLTADQVLPEMVKRRASSSPVKMESKTDYFIGKDGSKCSVKTRGTVDDDGQAKLETRINRVIDNINASEGVAGWSPNKDMMVDHLINAAPVTV